MRVLFVCSGNKKNDKIGIVVKNQGESLKKFGIEIDYFTIIGKGVIGYLKNIVPLKRQVKSKNYDIIHAHYLLSAIVASFIPKLPIIVSLMGSDIKSGFIFKAVIRLLYYVRWNGLIVKSERMKKELKLKNVYVIPNGVPLDKFPFLDKEYAKSLLNFNSKKHIIFVADPKNYAKNFELAEKSFSVISNRNSELNVIIGIKYDKIHIYMNAADCLLLTSRWEGSPNVVKEAMACNLPVVTTDVGDVRELLRNVEGCYIVSDNPDEIAAAIDKVLKNDKRTNGREIISNYLTDKIINERVILLYNKFLRLKKNS